MMSSFILDLVYYIEIFMWPITNFILHHVIPLEEQTGSASGPQRREPGGNQIVKVKVFIVFRGEK